MKLVMHTNCIFAPTAFMRYTNCIYVLSLIFDAVVMSP